MPDGRPWILVIAQILYEKGPLHNYEIEQSDAVVNRQALRRLRNLPGVISKTLNVHSEEGVSIDRSRRPPYIFGKTGEGRWFLNKKGMEWIKKHMGK